MPQLTPEAVETEMLRLLQSSPVPLTKAKLLTGRGKPLRVEILSRWLATDRLFNLGSSTKAAYIAMTDGKTPDLLARTERLILSQQPEQPVPLAITKLKTLAKYPKLKDLVMTAAENLACEKQGLLFKCGRSSYFLHLEPVRALLGLPLANAHPFKPDPIPSAVADPGEVIRSSYQKISTRLGTPNIPIADLLGACGLPLALLHDWLRTACADYRAVPARGEPTLASEDERAAAMAIDGELYYLIRLIP